MQDKKFTIVRKVANIKDWHDAVAEYKYMHGKEMPKAEVKVEKTIHLPLPLQSYFSRCDL